MAAAFFSNLGFVHYLHVILLVLTGLSMSSPIKPSGKLHRASVVGDNLLLDAQDFLSQFMSTLNLTKLRPPTRPVRAPNKPPEYMLELYNRFANDRTVMPSASIVRSFKNEDSSPYSVRSKGERIHPLLFNIFMPRHEHIKLAELRLFTLVRKAQRPYSGFNCKVTVYKTHEGVVWKKEVEKEERSGDQGEVVMMKDLEELVTKQIHAQDKTWVSLDLTDVVIIWQESGHATHRLEVHIASMGPVEEGAMQDATTKIGNSVEIGIETSLDAKDNAVMIVFSDDQSRDHKREKQELNQMGKHENESTENLDGSQQLLWGHVDHYAGQVMSSQDELQKQSATQLQSSFIYDAPSRIRRNVKSESCRRTPLFVNFKDIGWDSWIVQPLGYEAYACKGVCSPPLTSEVSPTKHAIVQSLLSQKSPERASRACCVPTKLEPISILYNDFDVITYNHKYEGMVVAECGCR